MRFSLLALALFAFTLVGCADSLTGPEFTSGVASGDAAARPADAPEPAPEPASPLFATWAGTDGRTTFALTFQEAFTIEETAIPNPRDIFAESEFSVQFDGIGSYNGLKELDSSLPCRVADGVFSQSGVSFDVTSPEGDMIARASGRISPDYSVIRIKMEYPDGTVVAIPFKKIDGPLVAATAGS